MQINGVLAAVDATKEPDLASRFDVKGYPTLKYFNRGEYKYDVGHARQEEQIIAFIKVQECFYIDINKRLSLNAFLNVKLENGQIKAVFFCSFSLFLENLHEAERKGNWAEN